MRTSEHPAESNAMELTDEALMQAHQHGDAAALAELVRRYANPLLGYLTRMNRDPQQAEDLFQETFLRVHTRAATFQPARRFKPWLYAIATHLSLDLLRRRERRPRLLSLDAEPAEGLPLAEQVADPGPDPSEAAARNDLRGRIRAAVETLPPRQRATLVLAYFEGLSYPETARTLGCTTGTVKKQMSRALHRLARLLPEAAPRPAEEGIR
jgi:RNA polymerase sigma-70 factor (ECF subfamily)